jgi:hypothetical protein
VVLPCNLDASFVGFGVGLLESPSTLSSGLVLRSVSWSATGSDASLRKESDSDDELRAVGDAFGSPKSGLRHFAASATERCMLSCVTGGESGSRKLSALNRVVGDSRLVKETWVMVEPLPLELPESLVPDVMQDAIDLGPNLLLREMFESCVFAASAAVSAPSTEAVTGLGSLSDAVTSSSTAALGGDTEEDWGVSFSAAEFNAAFVCSSSTGSRASSTL